MGWVKRNLFSFVGAMVALLLVALAGTYLISKLQPGNRTNPNSGVVAAVGQTAGKRYGSGATSAAPAPVVEPAPAPVASVSKRADAEVAKISLKIRAVSLTRTTGRPEANKEAAFLVLNEIRNSPVIDPNPQETRVSENLSGDEEPGTFTVNIVARLKHPMKVY